MKYVNYNALWIHLTVNFNTDMQIRDHEFGMTSCNKFYGQRKLSNLTYSSPRQNVVALIKIISDEEKQRQLRNSTRSYIYLDDTRSTQIASWDRYGGAQDHEVNGRLTSLITLGAMTL